MPLHTFECVCGEKMENLFYRAADVPRYKICKACGKHMHQTWRKAFNKKRSLTEILGNASASHHPQVGTDIKIESADHYRQLCKEYDMEEADDPVGGNRQWRKDQLENNKAAAGRKRKLADIATDEQVREAFL